MTAEQHSEARTPDARHEGTDVSIRPILAFAGLMIVAAVFVLVGVALLFSFFAGRQQTGAPVEFPMAGSEQNPLPPEPRLQTDPREDLRKLQDQEDGILRSYGWIDRNAGVVRIPISEAMRLTVERGLPSRPAPTSGQSGEATGGAAANEERR
jgi:hypothetical protein